MLAANVGLSRMSFAMLKPESGATILVAAKPAASSV